MKKIAVLLLLLFSFSSFTFAYTPTEKDKTQINKLYSILDGIYYKNPSKSQKILSQIELIREKYKDNERIYYLLTEIEKYIDFQIGLSLGKNVSVTDGDTISVTIDGVREKVRLIGIDTPETEVGEEYYGKEATEYLSSRIQGKDVYIEFDDSQGKRDKYQRLLAYVHFRYENIGNTMIKEGYAYEYTYDKAYKYQELYKESEKYASKNGLSLWNIPETPKTETQSTEITPVYTPGKPYYDPNDTSYLNMGFNCNKRKYCSYMESCDEVKYFFYVCGAKTFDRDKDGIPCESICGQE